MKTRSRLAEIVLCALAMVLFEKAARCQCTVGTYKVLSSTAVAVRCDEGDTGTMSGTATFTSASPSVPVLNATVTGYPGADEWLFLSLASPLSAGTKYKLTLKLSPAAVSSPKSVDIDTTSSFTVTPAISSAHPKTFDFTSNVLVIQTSSACDLKIQDALNEPHSITIHECDVPITQRMRQSPSPATAITNPEDIGVVHVTLEKQMSQQILPMSLGGVTDVFGKTPKIESKSRLVPPKAPASRDASSYYLNFSNLAATGTTPAWAIDGRISPSLGRLYRGFQFSPLASACVGVGQISGQSYTDTIDFGATASRIFEPNTVIQGLQITPGIVFETDKEFDRYNLLGTTDLRLNLEDSYNTKLRRQENRLQQVIEREEAKANLPGDTDPPIAWTLDDIKAPLFGYAYDIHGLVEAGGALTDTTMHASKGPATLNLPSYDIVRVGSKLHSLLELGRGSLDALFVGRYLTQPENSVFQTPQNTLYLKTISGWKAFLTLTGSISLDAEGHFAISVTYQDGFCPPKFNRSNSVLTGIVVKY
jgi:hypothetical protein